MRNPNIPVTQYEARLLRGIERLRGWEVGGYGNAPLIQAARRLVRKGLAQYSDTSNRVYTTQAGRDWLELNPEIKEKRDEV